MKTIGVLGGMGPESTVYVYKKMIEFCQKEYGAKYDSDFPQIVIYNLPVPDVVENKGNEEYIIERLKFGMEKLEAAGADFSFIACNSMEKFVPELRKRWSLLSIVEETAKEIDSKGIRKVGLLATDTTIRSNVYQQAMKGISLILPKNQEEITAAIMEILEGKKEEPNKKILKSIEEFNRLGIDAIILGCTDLPVAIKQDESTVILIDSAEIIAKAAIKKCFQ
ncbi:MAG: amino acid racemase [Candidatus ainarchaeum sp.]|nr:amino acid racemase [Candidatus ainarchaeum sp.]